MHAETAFFVVASEETREAGLARVAREMYKQKKDILKRDYENWEISLMELRKTCDRVEVSPGSFPVAPVACDDNDDDAASELIPELAPEEVVGHDAEECFRVPINIARAKHLVPDIGTNDVLSCATNFVTHVCNSMRTRQTDTEWIAEARTLFLPHAAAALVFVLIMEYCKDCRREAIIESKPRSLLGRIWFRLTRTSLVPVPLETFLRWNFVEIYKFLLRRALAQYPQQPQQPQRELVLQVGQLCHDAAFSGRTSTPVVAATDTSSASSDVSESQLCFAIMYTVYGVKYMENIEL